MHGIYHDVYIDASPEHIFDAVTSEAGLNNWWTDACSVERRVGGKYYFHFEPDYDWHAEVAEWSTSQHVVWYFTQADEDWTGTKLSFSIVNTDRGPLLRMEHTGWRTLNDHFRHTSYCWAQYLRKLQKHLASA